MGTDNEKNKLRFALNRQQLAEWNAQLALEVQARIALSDKHQEEYSWAYSDEINFLGRAPLATQHLKALKELTTVHRATRIALRQRHQQEEHDLTASTQGE
jgi:hypothetical protein